jgi:hypothetical protein
VRWGFIVGFSVAFDPHPQHGCHVVPPHSLSVVRNFDVNQRKSKKKRSYLSILCNGLDKQEYGVLIDLDIKSNFFFKQTNINRFGLQIQLFLTIIALIQSRPCSFFGARGARHNTARSKQNYWRPAACATRSGRWSPNRHSSPSRSTHNINIMHRDNSLLPSLPVNR